ncbi:MAG: hypothetical protein WAV20_10220, partial [Blastocatellia bacterium]
EFGALTDSAFAVRAPAVSNVVVRKNSATIIPIATVRHFVEPCSLTSLSMFVLMALTFQYHSRRTLAEDVILTHQIRRDADRLRLIHMRLSFEFRSTQIAKGKERSQ